MRDSELIATLESEVERLRRALTVLSEMDGKRSGVGELMVTLAKGALSGVDLLLMQSR
jgi:hypothetical protein